MPHHPPSPPAARAKLTRSRILAAALEIVDASGLNALTMRELGRNLGVEAMSLYHHFPNKAALLEGLGAKIIADIELPEAGTADWEGLVRDGLRAFWRTLRDHPNAVPLLTITPTITEPAMAASERLLHELSRAGIDPAEGHRLFRVMQAFTVGAATIGLARPSAEDVETRVATVDDLAERFPLLAQALPSAAAATPDEDFELGLELLLDALGRHLERS